MCWIRIGDKDPFFTLWCNDKISESDPTYLCRRNVMFREDYRSSARTIRVRWFLFTLLTLRMLLHGAALGLYGYWLHLAYGDKQHEEDKFVTAYVAVDPALLIKFDKQIDFFWFMVSCNIVWYLEYIYVLIWMRYFRIQWKITKYYVRLWIFFQWLNIVFLISFYCIMPNYELHDRFENARFFLIHGLLWPVNYLGQLYEAWLMFAYLRTHSLSELVTVGERSDWDEKLLDVNVFEEKVADLRFLTRRKEEVREFHQDSRVAIEDLQERQRTFYAGQLTLATHGTKVFDPEGNEIRSPTSPSFRHIGRFFTTESWSSTSSSARSTSSEPLEEDELEEALAVSSKEDQNIVESA